MNFNKKMFLAIATLTSFLSFQVSQGKAVSNFSQDVEWLFWVTVLGSIVVGLFVGFLVVYFIYKFREGIDTPRNHIKNEFKFEFAWVMLAIVLSSILILISTPVVIAMENPEDRDNAEVLTIKAVNWGWYWWNGSEWLNFDRHQLTLKTNTLYDLNLTSDDFIHSFFVPNLRFKVDAIPGKLNSFYFEVLEAGEYTVMCAEYCGQAHYDMITTFLVED